MERTDPQMLCIGFVDLGRKASLDIGRQRTQRLTHFCHRLLLSKQLLNPLLHLLRCLVGEGNRQNIVGIDVVIED